MTTFTLRRFAAGIVTGTAFACLMLASANSLAAELSSEQIATLIKQLDADRFAERQRASEQLSRAGKEAIQSLSDAAVGDSRETSMRAIQILKQHFDSNDPQAHNLAETALARIAESAKPAAAGIARRALQPQPGQAAVRSLRVGMGELRLQIRTVGAGGRVRVNHETGVKEIDADNDGRRIHIVDDPRQGITIEVSQLVDGKLVVETLVAKDADDLKQKHPAIAPTFSRLVEGAAE